MILKRENKNQKKKRQYDKSWLRFKWTSDVSENKGKRQEICIPTPTPDKKGKRKILKIHIWTLSRDSIRK